MQIIKSVILFLTWMILILPSLQSGFAFIGCKPLHGAYTFIAPPVFSTESWMSGKYQDQYQRYAEDSVGFKSGFVRLRNQLDWDIFSVPHPATVIRGEHGNLFTREYITASLGIDHLNPGMIDQRVRKLKILQEYLWTKKKIFLLVIIAPDKVQFSPEDIPVRFTRGHNGISGRDYLVKRCGESGIHFIDFNPWFRQMKETSRYPLFPATGTHWSIYGAVLAADSAIRYLEKHLQRPMAHLNFDRIETTTKPKQFDDDINETMNLIRDVNHPLFAYPVFHFTCDRSSNKPKALFIGDSFYWAWYDFGIIGQVFDKMEFWYYDREVYPEQFTRQKYTREVDLRQTIERQEIIVLMQVGGGWGNPGAGFIDRVYAAYFDSSYKPGK